MINADAQVNYMKSFGGSSNEYGYDVAINSQGGYFICGETLEITHDAKNNKMKAK